MSRVPVLLKKSLFLILGTLLLAGSLAAQQKPLTLTDIMKFKEISRTALSRDGEWAAYSTRPGRGDGEAVILSLNGEASYTLARGGAITFSDDASWAAVELLPEFQRTINTKKGEAAPETGVILMRTETGDTTLFHRVASRAFSADSRWLALLFSPPDGEKKKSEKKKCGTDLLLVNLDSSLRRRIPSVTEYAFDSTSSWLACAVEDTSGEENGLYALPLSQAEESPRVLLKRTKGRVSNLSWDTQGGTLAFLAADLDDSGGEKETCVGLWHSGATGADIVIRHEAGPAGWVVYHKNRLTWSRDGKRLFLGLKPQSQIPPEKEEADSTAVYDIDSILRERGVDVWHWNDDYINPQEKKMWPREKDRTYLAVYYPGPGRLVPLADETVPNVSIPDNSRFALARSNLPYRKLITWYGNLDDIYLIDLKTGAKKLVAARQMYNADLSPGGRYVAYYANKNWYLYDVREGTARNLTKGITTPFYNEDHDYPEPAPGYGLAGWTQKDEWVLIYDKYDLWKFSTADGRAVNLTGGYGRQNGYTFRVVQMDPRSRALPSRGDLLLRSYQNQRKNFGFYRTDISKANVEKVLEEDKKFDFLAKAEKSDTILYTRQDYREFPDLWVSDVNFEHPRRISLVNPRIADFAWGTAELVHWDSEDGIPLDGVLIKPGNYEPGKRYPVLVYYYRFFSQRLHEFNQMVINHRPNFPYYASNGYAVFLPDIRFEIGTPGPSAVKCLVPGVQKLIDMGIADPKGVALHGHSWSGYQTAFVITRTDMFACAVAGAPVSNMTSAYSGIRWGSGLARQMQYEQSQSRIGASLWERRDLYIENSPVFFADRIHTPLLIMFGDKDDAVPWYQGIELYLAMRRLRKDCVFLEYRDEPHHPQKYANKLDYTIRMKEYLDHYCKGAPAPEWLKKGAPYRGQ